MPGPQLHTAQNVAIDVEAAGLGDRILAAVIDYALLACYGLTMALITGLEVVPSSTSLQLLLLLPFWLYFLFCEILMNGQSLGKWVRHLRVVRLDGQAPSLGDYCLRWLLRPIDITLTLGNVAIICILATGRGQRLGDLAAGTLVAYVRKRTTLDDTILADLPADHRVTFPAVRRLSTEDVATAKDVLRTLAREDPPRPPTRVLAQEMKETLAGKMDVESDLSSASFLRTVLADYNALQRGSQAAPLESAAHS